MSKSSARRASSIEVLAQETTQRDTERAPAPAPSPEELASVDFHLVAACDLAIAEADWDTADVLIRVIERRVSKRDLGEEARQLAIVAIEQSRAIVAQGRKEHP